MNRYRNMIVSDDDKCCEEINRGMSLSGVVGEQGPHLNELVGEVSPRRLHLSLNLNGDKGPVSGTCERRAFQEGDPMVRRS